MAKSANILPHFQISLHNPKKPVNLCFFMSVEAVILWGGMKGSRGYSGDLREQCHARVTKVLGIVQLVLGVAVICARVAEVGGTRERCSPKGLSA